MLIDFDFKVRIYAAAFDIRPEFRWATRTDNGVSYTWDVTRSMFCPGNITEKIRVAAFDCSESILVVLGQLLSCEN